MKGRALVHDSPWLRPLGVLIAPGKTFASIAVRPTFLVPFLLLLLVGTAAGLVMTSKIDFGESIREATAESGREVPEEDLEQTIEVMNKFGWVFGMAGALVVQPVGLLLAALAFFLAFKIFGSEMTYGHSLAVICHAAMPILVVTFITLIVAAGKAELTPTEMQDGLVASNAAHFLSDDTSALVRAGARLIDFFSFWILALLLIGYRAVSGVKAQTATLTVISLWGVWMLLKFGLSAIQAAFG